MGRGDRQSGDGLRVGDELGAGMGSSMAYSAIAMVASHRNQIDVAGEHVARAARAFGQAGPEFMGNWLDWAQALLLEAHGHAHDA